MKTKSIVEAELLEFYQKYPIDHWIYKVSIFKNIIDNYDTLKDSLLNDLKDIIDVDCINMLKAEIHFTYFQMIEALFELIFALEKRKDKLLWVFLSISPFKANFKRISRIAKGNTSFLFKEVEIPSGSKVPFIQYVFYFGTTFPISNAVMTSNLEMIKKVLVTLTKDFSDRSVYNSYKHSLRFYQSPIRIELGEILEENKMNPLFEAFANNSFSFLCRDDKGNIELRTKAFDLERDINRINIIHLLIQNIINLRKRYFFTPEEKAKAWMFNKMNYDTLNISKNNLIEFKSILYWKKDSNS